MWLLNYCSPFRYEIVVGEITISRYLMYSFLLVQFLLYVFYLLKYKLVGEIINLPKRYSEQPQQVRKQAVSYDGCGQRQYRMNQKFFKQWFLHYFGLHSIAVAAAIMYSPYIQQIIFTFLHLIFLFICTIMQSCSKQGAKKIIYLIFLVLSVVLNVILLFTASLGVGSSGYDDRQKICFFDRI